MYHFIQKYQPKSIDECYMNREKREILMFLLSQQNFNLLFRGRQGVGKTTMIDLSLQYYYEMNNITDPNERESHILHVHVLNDMSISQTKQAIRTFCQGIYRTSPTVVIDNLDLIHEQVQQFLRHCMDTHGDRINFIFSCENNQKVIDALQSRCILFHLDRISRKDCLHLVKRIVDDLQITMNNDAISYCINHCNYNVIYIIQTFYKIKVLGRQDITIHLLKELCHDVHTQTFKEYTQLWYKERKFDQAKEKLFFLSELGLSVVDILEGYFNYCKETDILQEKDVYKSLDIFTKYITIFHSIHEDEFELNLFHYELCNAIYPDSIYKGVN